MRCEFSFYSCCYFNNSLTQTKFANCLSTNLIACNLELSLQLEQTLILGRVGTTLFLKGGILERLKNLRCGMVCIHIKMVGYEVRYSINNLFHFCPNQHKKKRKFGNSGQKKGDYGKTIYVVLVACVFGFSLIYISL